MLQDEWHKTAHDRKGHLIEDVIFKKVSSIGRKKLFQEFYPTD
jgi:hypothetical protein